MIHTMSTNYLLFFLNQKEDIKYRSYSFCTFSEDLFGVSADFYSFYYSLVNIPHISVCKYWLLKIVSIWFWYIPNPSKMLISWRVWYFLLFLRRHLVRKNDSEKWQDCTKKQKKKRAIFTIQSYALDMSQKGCPESSFLTFVFFLILLYMKQNIFDLIKYFWLVTLYVKFSIQEVCIVWEKV